MEEASGSSFASMSLADSIAMIKQESGSNWASLRFAFEVGDVLC